jgi:hypothetical protein
MNRKNLNIIIWVSGLIFSLSTNAYSQVENRWLSAGSFHNYYANIGSEIESGFIDAQQGGWQWPAIYLGQDALAMKGFWLGVRDFNDGLTTWNRRVVHVGPRVTGLGEFYPVSMETVSKYEPPQVFVDGLESFAKDVANERVDPNLDADREIRIVVNTLIGVTVKRTIKQFSQQFHDNYHVLEYTFINTGNIDSDPEIELPGQDLEGFIPFFLNRMAPVKATRFTIGNASGWGINTMNDRRGDGLRPLEPEQFRASFAWHGYWPNSDVDYDNIGAPIFVPNTVGGFLAPEDTTGRLAAYHFVGTVTLQAPGSVANTADDPNQPFTMAFEHNDDPLYFNNDPFDAVKMEAEYNMMSRGRVPRHAYIVEPSGFDGFVNPSGDPSLGEAGGQAYTYGYGPYDLAFGDSVTIVIAEGSSGISRELAASTGADFKNGVISAEQKNRIVFQGRDSLFQTFERAIANYNSGYTIARPPEPPSIFNVNSAGDGVSLEWEFDGNVADLEGFEIYRASGRVDSTYRLLYRAGPEERSVRDGDGARQSDPGVFLLDTPIRGRDYFYYIVSVGAVNNDNTGLTPTGNRLVSNRYFSQSYDPARLLRQAGEAMEQIRVVPNPYNPNASSSLLLDQTGRDRIAFYEIPGISTIEIYTEIGELIRTIEHTNGSGDEDWDLRTDSRQRVVSGIYIARIVNKDPNDDEFGQVAIRKIVIIL